MSKNERDKKAKRGRRAHTKFISTRLEKPGAQKLPPFQTWPIVRAYVPLEECWLATGFGSGGIVRQRPDGKLITAFFGFSLLDRGITGMFGKNETDLGEIDDCSRICDTNSRRWSKETSRYSRVSSGDSMRSGCTKGTNSRPARPMSSNPTMSRIYGRRDGSRPMDRAISRLL